MDPSRFRGASYGASNWTRVGRTKGFARHNGACTDPHGEPKEMFVRALLEDVDVRGRVLTLDAPHSNRGTERAIVESRLKQQREMTLAPKSFGGQPRADWSKMYGFTFRSPDVHGSPCALPDTGNLASRVGAGCCGFRRGSVPDHTWFLRSCRQG